MKQQNLSLQNLYKLPWTNNNNPNGWIEPTTYCQLACPGCYRGLALPNPTRIHEDLANLKKNIDTLIKIRKIKILSIAGGEPLLYPKLNELISYANNRGLQVRLLTNGVALTKERLLKLKSLGLTEVIIHIAKYQNRPGYSNKNEGDLNKLRGKYCQMFRQVKGVDLDFIMTVSQKNYGDLPIILDFYKKNSDIVSHIFFTFFKDFFFKKPKDETKDSYITVEKLASLINRNYGIKPCAYLGKKINPNGVAWLFYVTVFFGNKIIGYIDADFFKKLHNRFYQNGKYIFPVNGNKVNLIKSVGFFLHPTVRRILGNYFAEIIKNPSKILKPVRFQLIVFINPPDFTPQGWDFCDGCPDAILYNGKLVPSCLLERIKQGENILL